MSKQSSDKPISIGSPITTACGCQLNFSSDTTFGMYQDRWVYFCLPICKQDFDQDPLSSCLALQLAMEKND
jgi:YHS domain-containing protein